MPLTQPNITDPGEPITVITRAKSGEDDYGNDEFAETSVTVQGAFDPAIGYEATDARETVVNQPQALLPFDTAVDATSVLVIRGDRYEVDGTPNYWQSPFDWWQPGVQVPLRRVTG